MSCSPQGREILASDELLDALVKLLSASGNAPAQRLAADALLHVAGVASIALTPSAGAPATAEPVTIHPKPQLVAKGAMEGLLVVSGVINIATYVCAVQEQGTDGAYSLPMPTLTPAALLQCR